MPILFAGLCCVVLSSGVLLQPKAVQATLAHRHATGQPSPFAGANLSHAPVAIRDSEPSFSHNNFAELSGSSSNSSSRDPPSYDSRGQASFLGTVIAEVCAIPA